MLVHTIILYWLLKHPVFQFTPPPNTVSETARVYLPFTVQPLCDLKALCRAIDHQVLPSQPLLREAEDFPSGGKYFNHVLLLT